MIIVLASPSEIDTPDKAEVELGKLANKANEVMYPDSRRNIGRKRSEINTAYDRMIAHLNFMGNKESRNQKKWQALASQAVKDRKLLSSIKDSVMAMEYTLF